MSLSAETKPKNEPEIECIYSAIKVTKIRGARDINTPVTISYQGSQGNKHLVKEGLKIYLAWRTSRKDREPFFHFNQEDEVR